MLVVLAMRIAIYSDVHSNLEALKAVVEDIESQRIDLRICLGDTVGYNANPVECLALVKENADIVIKGNHDAACAGEEDLAFFSPLALAGIVYSRQKLSPADVSYLKKLPLRKDRDEATYVHASLFDPDEWDYVLTTDDALLHFSDQTSKLCFCGHTHAPVIWMKPPGSPVKMIRSGTGRDLDDESRYLVNVGSVGQNRDGDPRACYVVFDTDARKLTYRRVTYPVEKAQQAVRDAGLPEILAVRLQLGR